ncbi:MAG: hypothetical protein NTU57_04900 [Candidatus Aenigmarchaeota archaeon]|nr:hypothetical protein [Candidatus Aenigmarchaeota archaeon]
MAKITNNMIAVLLVIAIVVSGFSFLTISNIGKVKIKTTGGASTGTGTANVTIGQSTDIILIRSVTNFGTGALGGAIRTLTTQQDNWDTFRDGTEGNGTSGGDVWGTCDGTDTYCAFPFVVQNAGNVNVSINMSAAQAATDWIGTGGLAYFKGKNNETAACGIDFGALGEGSWTTLATSETVVCNSLDFSNSGSDEIRIHFNITVPSDATGSKGVMITVGAVAA